MVGLQVGRRWGLLGRGHIEARIARRRLHDSPLQHKISTHPACLITSQQRRQPTAFSGASHGSMLWRVPIKPFTLVLGHQLLLFLRLRKEVLGSIERSLDRRLRYPMVLDIEEAGVLSGRLDFSGEVLPSVKVAVDGGNVNQWYLVGLGFSRGFG